jgi:tripartite ATP-independent transporter DctM subunit
MSIEVITVIMLGSLVLALFLGLPVAFTLGGLGALFTVLFWGPEKIYLIVFSAWSVGVNFLFVCIPLFVFMGYIIESSGIAEDLYTMMHRWVGPLKGGLAMGTVGICTAFAAMAGTSGAGTVTMGVTALPSLLKRGYDKSIALGCILSGGALGILIPPSVMMILYGALSGVSVGKLFMGGVFPGLLLSGMFVIYIGIRCGLNPKLGPSLPPQERASWKLKLASVRAVILPILIAVGVLGSIYTGMATPTEAAAVGVVGALAATLIYRRFNRKMLTQACQESYKTILMVYWIIIGATIFSQLYDAVGGATFVTGLLLALHIGKFGILIGIMLIIFVMGMFMDPGCIVMITTPIFVPVVEALGLDLLWFGILFTVNLEMSYLTPPIGMNLFMLKGVSPPDVTMRDMYRAAIPFAILQAAGLAVIIMFPEIALWLPGLMSK